MSAVNPSILILGCFDTKGEIFAFLRQCILSHGDQVIAINTGVLGTTGLFPVDFESEQVASEAGQNIIALREKADRGFAIDSMGKGAAKIVSKLVKSGKFKGAIGMGGGGGTYITLTAMQEIPLGIPKICISTLATKDLSRQIGTKDITLIPSVVDVAGLNSISKPIIRQAAAAICGMAKVTIKEGTSTLGSVAISMFGNTTACVNHCTELLQNKGYEVYAFHANGVGGKAMESLIREGCFDAVLDITTTELADELCGGVCSAGADRLNGASEMGIPQVVVPGCMDMVNFSQLDTVPGYFQSRKLYSWAPDVTLMRTDIAENQKLGKILSDKLNRSTAETVVLLPKKGLSQIDAEGGVFYQPESNKALFDSIKKYVRPKVKVEEVEANINDPVFSTLATERLIVMLEKVRNK